MAGFEADTRDENLLSTKGVHWVTDLRLFEQLNGDRNTYGRIATEFSFYIPLSRDSGLVLANRIAGGTTTGKPSFFQQMHLGGPLTMRGYRTNRFTGRSMLYHNIELRAKLFNFTSYLFPGSVGLVGFHDLGRVWTPGESSKTWHNSYGGGFYIIPAEVVLIQALAARSDEGTLPYVSIGFRF